MLTLQNSEKELIATASKGDLEAFNQLVLAHQDSAYQYAFSLMKDPDMADDVTQESFIKAFQNISSFQGGSFRGWVLKIVVNTARDYWRRLNRHPTLSLFAKSADGEELDSPAWFVDPSASVEETVQRKDDCYALNQILDELPLKYRDVITLVDVQELDYIEAARVLQIPIGTVKSRLVRARLQIREKLMGGLSPSRAALGVPLLLGCS